jgi:hypothetical protein
MYVNFVLVGHSAADQTVVSILFQESVESYKQQESDRNEVQ